MSRTHESSLRVYRRFFYRVLYRFHYCYFFCFFNIYLLVFAVVNHFVPGCMILHFTHSFFLHFIFYFSLLDGVYGVPFVPSTMTWHCVPYSTIFPFFFQRFCVVTVWYHIHCRVFEMETGKRTGREANEECCWFPEGYSVYIGMATTLLYCWKTSITSSNMEESTGYLFFEHSITPCCGRVLDFNA